MSYVDDHLLPGERVIHTAHLHKIVFVVPAILTVAALALGVLLLTTDNTIGALVSFAAAAIPALWAYIAYTSSEFAITDKRVIIKVGWIQRRTLETMLAKIEGIGVDQGIVGRILDYGTITVTGTGGTREPFTNIAAPLEFRRQVQAQISAAESARAVPYDVDTPRLDAVPRAERDCPYCAERILVRAKVCKHCGRDVEPLVAS